MAGESVIEAVAKEQAIGEMTGFPKKDRPDGDTYGHQLMVPASSFSHGGTKIVGAFHYDSFVNKDSGR